MATKSLSKLLERREDLDERITKLMRERAEVDRQIFPRFKQLAAAVDGDAAVADVVHRSDNNVILGEAKARPKALVEEIEKVLRDAKGPLRTSQILMQLTTRGVTVGGKRPLNNLAAHLSHHDKHFAREGEGWVLRTNSLIDVANTNAHAH